MAWARSLLAEHLRDEETLVQKVELATHAKLALAYEQSCVAAYFYARSAIPQNFQLEEDLLKLTKLLGRLYVADSLGQIPFSTNPDALDSQEVASILARPQLAKGQGFRVNVEQRKAIEVHAMNMAAQYLSLKGYSVEDVSAKGSFDLLAIKGIECLKIEVKGTTGALSSVFLTRNEVELHKTTYPANGLIVVHGVNVREDASEVSAADGGTIAAWLPWRLEEARLQGITYSYLLA